MKFQFEGYLYPDETKDYIEIDFDFLGKSEFIRTLEPDEATPIMIPERFSNYQIDEFKILLEKITKKEELTEEDKYLSKSKVLKPLFEFFMMNKEFMDDIDNIKEDKTYYYIQKLECNEATHDYEVELPRPYERNYITKYKTLYKSKEEALKAFRIKLYELFKSKKTLLDIFCERSKIYKNIESKELYFPIYTFGRCELQEDYFIFRHMNDYNYTIFKLEIKKIELKHIQNHKISHKYEDYKFNFFSYDEFEDNHPDDENAIINDDDDEFFNDEDS